MNVHFYISNTRNEPGRPAEGIRSKHGGEAARPRATPTPPPPKQTSAAPTTAAGQRPNERIVDHSTAAKPTSAKNTGASTQITRYSGQRACQQRERHRLVVRVITGGEQRPRRSVNTQMRKDRVDVRVAAEPDAVEDVPQVGEHHDPVQNAEQDGQPPEPSQRWPGEICWQRMWALRRPARRLKGVVLIDSWSRAAGYR